ncbi:MAG TPA: tetratricopeptide repeat protein [Ideonella sp.]|uniref:tetratricopeptide repeat protein n=1 Tax=Ideonella sp. TaxID=1929293 RepID=UPI002E37275C|nr:tetratricopeptide repeat protein [Ideonella sp.]HEX5688107.1 tetratricopeptide repeat protein [Ideonella sp.]
MSKFSIGLLLAATVLTGPAAADEMNPAERHAALGEAVVMYQRGDHEGAELRFTALVAAGEPAAAHNLAVMHLRGELPNASVARARELLMQAAGQGFVTAQLALGELYESGRLGAPDLPQALAWYERAALSGSVDAQVAAGTAYFMGRGTPVDAAQAVHWYRQAANGGDVGAQYILGSMYEKGDGVSADLRLARYWYAAAARQGDEAAPAKLKDIDARLTAQ